jgi:hypothetical protein
MTNGMAHRIASLVILAGFLAACGEATPTQAASREKPRSWPVHSQERPKPEKVDPGPYTGPQPAPSDATVLFAGKTEHLNKWEKSDDGSKPGWIVDEQDRLQVVPKTGSIQTKQTFGDCQLHIEWMANPDSPGEGQHRSNSGVFFGWMYEVQILDTYSNKTYADGYAGALYGQYPPMVNATRPAGQWQTYDILYDRPRFNDAGKAVEPAQITVFHNGILVQHHEPLTGPTNHKSRPPYKKHGKVAIGLQDHKDDPIWFKNIWVRELE